MDTLTPPWSVHVPCETSAQWLEDRLSCAGLRAVRTFDLHDARPASPECACPHHGTAACDCQMVVILVYAEARLPVTMVVHGNDGQSWISVIDRPDQRADPSTIAAIQRALEAEA
jgi:hypothetical protein